MLNSLDMYCYPFPFIYLLLINSSLLIILFVLMMQESDSVGANNINNYYSKTKLSFVIHTIVVNKVVVNSDTQNRKMFIADYM